MIKINKLKLATLSLALLASVSGTANAATANASASLDIQAAFSLTKDTDLAFGSVFLPGAGGGTLTIGNDGSASVTGTGMIAPASGTTAAAFSVAGPASTAYSITLPSSITISGGGTDLTVDTFTDSVGGTATLDGTGAGTFTVGAKVTIPANAAVASYTGTFDVTVDY